MRIARLTMLALLALAPVGASAQAQDATVQADAARAEIERILEADNLDADRLSPREIVEIMQEIERGRAPEDFWTAYQAHLRAWERFAELSERFQHQRVETAFAEGVEELIEAEEAVNTTFSQVESIARRYGARLPVSPVDLRSIA